MTKRAKTAEATRQRIIDQSMILFAREGYAAASVRRIAKSCGLTIGAVHHHFGTKERLQEEVRLCADRYLAEIFRQLWGEFAVTRDVGRMAELGLELARQQQPAVRFRMREWLDSRVLSTGRRSLDSTLLKVVSENIASQTKMPATTIRAWLLSLVFLVGRFSLADEHEIEADLGSDYDESMLARDLALMAKQLLTSGSDPEPPAG